MNQSEEWRDVKGYEGYYQVSNYGRVKSLKRKRSTGPKPGILKERILKGTLNGEGYRCVKLYKNGFKKTFKIHTLLADAFIPLKYWHECVNHKDGDKSNNRISNIERCTIQYNVIHAFENNLNHRLDIDEQVLRKLYVEKELPVKEIAEVFECCVKSVRNYIRKYELQRRAI